MGLIALFAFSCASKADLDEIKNSQKETNKQLKAIATALKSGAGVRAQAAKRPRPKGPDPKKTYAFPVGNSPTKGPADALVTVIEISDFEWPFCKRVGPTLKQITDKYGDDVRIVFKHNPLSFHKRAMAAANASMCANEQEKFWEMHDAIFENMRKLKDEDLQSYASKVGLNMDKFKSCYAANKYRKQILNDQRTAVALGARGTPAFFVNGRFLSGAQSFDKFEALIDEELAKAKKTKIAKAKYYEKEIIGKGLKRI